MSVTKENFKEELGKITDNCAFVKCNEDEIEYIRIDTQIFDNPETMAREIVEYVEKMKQASDMVMEYDSIDDLGKYIDPFIIKYHPSWMYARAASGLIPFEEGEEICTHPNLVKTYDRWFHDYFIATGIEPLEKPNIKPDIPMTLSVFESIFFNEENLDENPVPAKYHKDQTAFQHTLAYMNSIDEYQKQITAHKRPKYNFKGASYKLSKDGFPIIVFDYKDYDFRRDKQEENCSRKVAKKTKRSGVSSQLTLNREVKRKF